MGLFSLLGGIIGGNKQAKAAKQAAQMQYDAALKGIAETARQFDVTRQDFAPYQQAGVTALDRFGDLLGLNGREDQQREIDLLRASPLYKSLYGSGEEAILANASATGGLRGGNTNRSLYELGEDTLARLIERQLAGYGGLIDTGTGAAGTVGAFGANAVAQQGAARERGAGAMAQSQLVRGGIAAQNWQNVGSTIEDAIKAIAGGAGGGTGGFNWQRLLI